MFILCAIVVRGFSGKKGLVVQRLVLDIVHHRLVCTIIVVIVIVRARDRN